MIHSFIYIIKTLSEFFMLNTCYIMTFRMCDTIKRKWEKIISILYKLSLRTFFLMSLNQLHYKHLTLHVNENLYSKLRIRVWAVYCIYEWIKRINKIFYWYIEMQSVTSQFIIWDQWCTDWTFNSIWDADRADKIDSKNERNAEVLLIKCELTEKMKEYKCEYYVMFNLTADILYWEISISSYYNSY